MILEQNDLFEKVYDQKYRIKYGDIRNNINDELLLEDNIYPHKYSIQNRADLRYLDVYSIDPEGCKDADDAFSIFEEKNSLGVMNLFLAIHIADPTEYINLNSKLWLDILQRNITKYPSFREPIHLMPSKIMELSSLNDNSAGNIKKAITILFTLNDNYEITNSIEILFSIIKVKKENALTYKKASEYLNDDGKLIYPLAIGLKINEALQRKRSEKSLGIKLNEVKMAYPILKDDRIVFGKDTVNEKNMKQMIAEFAILANSYIGEYLNIYFDGKAIFRCCEAENWLNSLDKNINGNDLLNKIIDNGIKAEYNSNIVSHDLVGSNEYTHFTSPIRRVSDCICHYLIKHLYLTNNLQKDSKNILNTEKFWKSLPFDKIFLDSISDRCSIEIKKFKKIQYNDTKFRYIQCISNLLSDLSSEKQTIVRLTYRIVNYSGLFVNILISNINSFKIHLSYSLRIKVDKYINYSKEKKTINITKINIPGKYDEGCIPELDDEIKKIFCS